MTLKLHIKPRMYVHVYQCNPGSTVYAMFWNTPKGVVSLTRFWCSFVIDNINLHHSGYLQTGTLVNSEDPDEMKHCAHLNNV